ncbi:MAG TPA: ATP-binding protein [Burkholderiales bacterium]|nr:ATP-binding protein [Burkholderiales bacterium]
MQLRASEDPVDSTGRRVLLLAPTARDGAITTEILLKACVECVTLRNLYEMSREVAVGAGALLLTEDVFAAPGAKEFLTALDAQPDWSDIPIVMMMKRATDSPVGQRMIASFRNVILLERPAPIRSLVSAVQAAIRGRLRQYEIRDQIEAVRHAEARARELQQQLELAVEASELGTFHCELRSGRIFWNDRCKAHFWLPPDRNDIDFDLFYSLLHDDDRERTRQAVGATLQRGASYDIEYRTVSPDGRVRWVHATGRTYYDAMGRPERFDGTTRDITMEKLGAEERRLLLESERAARQEAERVSGVKDEFLATLSHELRTPLNAIFGWTQLLRAGKDDLQTREHALGVIDRNVRLQTQLIEDLLDMSRIVSGKVRLDIQPVDLPEIVDAALESVRPAAEAKNIRTEKSIDADAGPVSGDPGRLQQILWNLLTNAIKFTDKNGSVRVAVVRVHSDVEISVSDDGQGISADFLPNLFSRFSQADSSIKRKHGGLGLGLSIVKGLVEMHGGTVRAASPGEGRGSTFTVRLPLRAVRLADTPATRRQESPMQALSKFDASRLHALKVLVVDDEPDARELIKRFLTACEAVPILAGSVDEALRLVEMFRPDVIVSDIGMPDRDGYVLMREIRSQSIHTPAVALTAFARTDDRVRALMAGYQTHLAKPFEPLELLAIVSDLSGR